MMRFTNIRLNKLTVTIAGEVTFIQLQMADIDLLNTRSIYARSTESSDNGSQSCQCYWSTGVNEVATFTTGSSSTVPF